MRLLHRLHNAGQVGGILRSQVYLTIGYTKFFERAIPVPCNTNDTLQWIIGCADGRNQHISGTQYAV